MKSVPARPFAAAWLNVFRAAADDEERPAIHRVVHVENHTAGVRLVATDSYMVLHSSVVDAAGSHSIDLDEAPLAGYSVIDADGRAKALLTFVFGATKDTPDAEVVLTIRSAENDGRPTLDPTLDRQTFVMEFEGERLSLPIYEGAFPAWRGLLDRPEKAARQVGFNAAVIGRLDKLKTLGGNPTVQLRLSGETGPASVFVAIEPALRGAVMPVRLS